MNIVRCSVVFLNRTLVESTEGNKMYLEGTNITFICPFGRVLIGANTSICTENGEWEPDPRGLKCSGKDHHSTGTRTVKIVIEHMRMRDKHVDDVSLHT